MAILRYVLVCGLLSIVPSLLIGSGGFNDYSILAFVFFSLVVPLVIRQSKRFKEMYAFPWKNWCYLYSWLGWTLFFTMGNAAVPISLPPDAFLLRTLISVVAMVFMLLLMVLTTVLLTQIMNRRRCNDIFDTTVDIVLYTQPIPLLLIGDMLFMDVRDPAQGANLQSVFGVLTLLVYVLIIVTMAGLAIYLYPRESHIIKGLRFVRILVTAMMWLAINGHFLYGVQNPWLLGLMQAAMPMFQGSVLVYITPFIFECLAMLISVVLGYYLEKLVGSWWRKRRRSQV